jgi:membrane-associated protein
MVPADFFIQYIEHFSYLGIFLFLVFAGHVLPIPEEIILLVVGYLAADGVLKLSLGLTVTLVALLIGDNIIYRLAQLPYPWAERIRQRVYGMRYIRVHRAYLEKHVRMVVLVTRMLPFLRFVGPVMAGSLYLPKAEFQKYNFIGMIAYTPLVVLAGYYGHGYLDELLIGFDDMKKLVLVCLAVLAAAVAVHGIFYVAVTRNR